MEVSYWPPGLPREETVAAFERALAHLGFQPCATRVPEKGVEKVALFALQDKPTHVAKLVAKQKWSSKLGEIEDIEHTLEALRGPEYGIIVQIYSRRIES